MMKTKGWRTRRLGLAVVSGAALLVLAGCSTVPLRSVESFSKGIAATRNQTVIAFQGVTDLTSDAMVDYAARQPTLNDASVLFVLDPGSRAAWDRVFAGLESYAQTLVLLESPHLAQEAGKSATGLGREIKNAGESLSGPDLSAEDRKLFGSLSAAVTKLGDLVLRTEARSGARGVLIAADPVVRGVFVQMAEAIDPGDRRGIRGTVNGHWNQRKGRLTTEFLETQDISQKRRLAREYADLMGQQMNQDMALNSLRRSLLALADVHHALAYGNEREVAVAMAVVDQETRALEELSKNFKTGSGGRLKEASP
jgi:hypothetical protein